MNQTEQYSLLGLISSAYPYRTTEKYFGKYTSLVLTGTCNFMCRYCDVGGYNSNRLQLPDIKNVALKEIEEFILQEIKKSNIICLSGGEPLLMPELILHLAKFIRENGGYSILNTNAFSYERMEQVLTYVDEVSISIKGDKETASYITGKPVELAFSKPYQNTIKISDKVPTEVVIVLFDFLTPPIVAELVKPFVGSAYITLKHYRPKRTKILEENSYKNVTIDEDEKLKPMSREQMYALYNELLYIYPEAKDHLNLVLDSGQSQIVRRDNKDYLITREAITVL